MRVPIPHDVEVRATLNPFHDSGALLNTNKAIRVSNKKSIKPACSRVPQLPQTIRKGSSLVLILVVGRFVNSIPCLASRSLDDC